MVSESSKTSRTASLVCADSSALTGELVMPGAHTRVPSPPPAGSGQSHLTALCPLPDRRRRTREARCSSPLLPAMIFPPKVLPRRWRGTTSCCPRTGTPALGRLGRTRPQLVTVYSTFGACQPLSVHIYRIPRLLSKSGSQVDDYPIFIDKEPSAFPTAHCYRSQAVQATESGRAIKEPLRKQTGFLAVRLLYTGPLDPSGGYICLPSAFLPI